MPNNRPSTFIGSSTEGLSIAEAIQQNLDRNCEAAIWSQGVFGLGEGALESLVRKSLEFDFAILVLTPDDLIHSRKKTQSSPRDNVLFELGLFIGGIGRDRTFVVYDRTASLKLPTDLAGVTYATYEPHTTSGNYRAALGSACAEIKAKIQHLGSRQKAPATNICGSHIVGKRGSVEAKEAMRRIIDSAKDSDSSFLCVAGIANKDFFDVPAAQDSMWRTLSALLEKVDKQVRVLFLDPDSTEARLRGVFESIPDRNVIHDTVSAIRSPLAAARKIRLEHANFHIRLSSEMPCFLLFNHEEMLVQPYLTSAVGSETDITRYRHENDMYQLGKAHFENLWKGRWVLFDIGNVLIDFNHDLVPSKLWEYLSKNNTGGQQIPSQEEIKHFIFDPANPAHSRNSKIDCGVHTIDWLRDEFCEQFKCSIPSNTFKEYWNSIFGKAKSEGIRCMKDLRSKGICIGICSNTNQSHWEFICKNFPEIRDTACDWFLSFELKSRKPDPMFYELISERTKTPSGNLLLFDDVEANVLGARHAGLKAELFSKTSTFDDVLKFVTGKFFDSCHPADACACLTKH